MSLMVNKEYLCLDLIFRTYMDFIEFIYVLGLLVRFFILLTLFWLAFQTYLDFIEYVQLCWVGVKGCCDLS
jgi:hypothetical protein